MNETPIRCFALACLLCVLALAVCVHFAQRRAGRDHAMVGVLQGELFAAQRQLTQQSIALDTSQRTIGELHDALDLVSMRAPILLPMARGDFLRFTSPFGYRVIDQFTAANGAIGGGTTHHTGLDMVGTWRARIEAAADGTVVDMWPPPGTVINGVTYKGHPVYGGCVIIQHNGFQTLYAHMSVIYVHEGNRVTAGQVIGRQGDTGEADGAHLHFEVRVDGEPVNPLQWIEGEK